MSPGKDPVPVLVVEDNQRYAELIERMLGPDFAPKRATTLAFVRSITIVCDGRD